VSKHQPIDVMTRWVSSGQCDSGFELGEEGELRDNNDISSVIRCKNQDLGSAEIVNHLKTGMHVSKLALNWQQRLEFVLDEKLVVKRLRFADIVQEQASDIEAEDAAAQFDVDFSIMALELSGFIEALTAAFGGAEAVD
jgi:recombination associated protein RdgC